MAKKKEEVLQLTSVSALEQAGNTLLLATEKADYNNDVDALLKIALGWMEIHEYLAGTPHHDKKQEFGFASTKADDEEEVEELDDAISTEECRTGTTSRGTARARRVEVRS
jgi:hypothetical protein